MTNRLSKLFICLIASFLLLPTLFGNLQAAELTFNQLPNEIETLDEIQLTISGAKGEIVWQALKGEIRGTGESVTYIAPRIPEAETIIVKDANDNIGTLKFEVKGFLSLRLDNILFLLIIGFIGGLISGFIGSSGAFILTPAMMSMGVPAIMAVASNMCHKFPKALVGSMKRAKYGEVDIKLGIIMGISAEAGVLYGATIQTEIQQTFGNVGSNLYVSLVFVLILAIIGGYVLRNAIKMYKSGKTNENETEHKITKAASWVQSINIPATMIYLPSIGTKISVLFIIPLGFATGMLAATIAVGGFIGIPAMMYILGVPGIMASGTELIIAFVIGIGGTIQYGINGLVDIRLAMILLAGSLFGVQLGVIGTSYVKDFMVKMVLGIIMVLVLFSIGLKIPVYLSEMGKLELNQNTTNILDYSSFAILILALTTSAIIILYALFSGYRKHAKEQRLLEEQEAIQITEEQEFYPTSISGNQLSPIGRFERILAVTDGSEASKGSTREAIRLAQRTEGTLALMSVLMTNPEHESMVRQLIEKENNDAKNYLEALTAEAKEAGISSEFTIRHGIEIHQEIVDEAEKRQVDIIVMGRRGLTGLQRLMMGSNTAKVIGYAHCSVLVVPKNAKIAGKKILLSVDGSRYSDTAATAAMRIAKILHAEVLIISVVYSDYQEKRHHEAVENVKRVETFMTQEGIKVSGQILSGKPGEAIIEVAKSKGVDLIVIGSHGRTGLDRLLMGSVSDRVIGYSDCAVLVVKTA